MAETVVPPLRLHHAIVVAGAPSIVPVVIRTDRATKVQGTIERLHAGAARRGGFVTTVYAPNERSARKAVRTYTNAAYAALHSKPVDLTKTTKLRAVIYSAQSWDTGELDVRTIIDEPTDMYGTRAFTDYLKSQGLDRYAVDAPTDAAALSAAWELFMDDVYTDDVYAVHATV